MTSEAEARRTQVALPAELDPRRLRRRAAQVALLIALLVLVALLAPGLGEVRDRLEGADPGWLAIAVVLEALSCLSYVLMFRPIFCPHMSRRTSRELAWSELGVGAIVPASGAGGLALGAWVLHQGGMPGDKIARRSVAFFLIKSSVNFFAVAIVGIVAALGVGADLSPLLTVLPAALSIALIAAVLAIGRLGAGEQVTAAASRARRWLAAVRGALTGGVEEAVRLVRSLNPAILAGAIGYWAFDNAVLWATFEAVGESPPIIVILLGYLIGQLGGLLPLPGGVGGIDGGLVGTFVVYGAPADVTVAAVLAYRLILFWLPLAVGAIAFASLRRGLNRPDRPDLCEVPPVTGELPVLYVPKRA
jgi:uncharacterized protein (TIRG00374 family)